MYNPGLGKGLAAVWSALSRLDLTGDLRVMVPFSAIVVILLIFDPSAICNDGYFLEGEVISVYNNFILIRTRNGSEEAAIVKNNARLRGITGLSELKRWDYVRIGYQESIAGVPIADIVDLDRGILTSEASFSISTDDLANIIGGTADYMLVDLRDISAFNSGHLPTAISLPVTHFSEEMLKKKLKSKKSCTIIFYSQNGRDTVAHRYASAFAAGGFKNVRVYIDGIDGWVRKGNFVVISISYLEKLLIEGVPLVIVDTRPSGLVSEGHIPGAINVKKGELRDDIVMPWDAADPIVFYGQDHEDDSAAWNAMMAAKWGYFLKSNHPVMLLDGGFDAWKQVSRTIEKGEVPKAVVRKPVQRFGIIFYDELKDLLTDIPRDIILLDVRTKDEAGLSRLNGILNIPLAELPYNIQTLQRDKEIIVFCSVGTRARIAHAILKKNGFKSRYLNHRIKINTDGTLQ